MALNVLKHTLDKLFPSLMDLRRSYNLRQDNKRLFDARQQKARRSIFEDLDVRVLSGPFQGMLYIDERVWGPIEPRWLGTYEAELHNLIDDMISRGYDTIIDVGSAEGYYAVGLARALPKAAVYSYEVDPWSRAQQRRLCILNGVQNLSLMGRCTHAEIDLRSSGRTLLICDIEGFEKELLDPTEAVAFSKIDILVEVHKFGEISMKAMEKCLTERFVETHQVASLMSRPRTPEDLKNVPVNTDLEYLNEWRDDNQVWLWMQSRKIKR